MLLSKLYKKKFLTEIWAITNFRTISTTKIKRVEHFEEIRIPVPWGHVAGQWWGPKTHRPILALPGLKDNIGSLLPLVEEISKHIGVICIEWSGHGYSSRFPPGFGYSFDTAVTVLGNVLDYFNWDKISLMGHSLGSGTAFIYASLYPEKVDFIIGIDALVPLATNHKDFCDVRRVSLERIIDIDKGTARGEQKLFTYEEAQREVSKYTKNSIPIELTPHILKRELIKSNEHPDKYYFTTDPRHDVRLYTYPKEALYAMAENVKCPILNLKGTDFLYVEGKTVFNNVCEILRKNKVPLQTESIQGFHHIHLTNTKACAPIIKEFIQKYDTEKRFTNN